MKDSSETSLPVASETDAELAALDAQSDADPVPLRKEAATSGLLPIDRAEDTSEPEN